LRQFSAPALVKETGRCPRGVGPPTFRENSPVHIYFLAEDFVPPDHPHVSMGAGAGRVWVPILVPELEDLCPPEDRVDLRLILHHLFVGAAGDGSINIPETVPWWAACSAYIVCRGQARLIWHWNMRWFRPVPKDRSGKPTATDPTLDAALKERAGDESIWGQFEGTVADVAQPIGAGPMASGCGPATKGGGKGNKGGHKGKPGVWRKRDQRRHDALIHTNFEKLDFRIGTQ